MKSLTVNLVERILARMFLALVRDYSDLLVALAAKRKLMGIPQLALDDYVGLPDGYTGKIEAGHRGLGPLSFGLYVQGLGLTIQIADSHRPLIRRPRRPDPRQLRLPLELSMLAMPASHANKRRRVA